MLQMPSIVDEDPSYGKRNVEGSRRSIGGLFIRFAQPSLTAFRRCAIWKSLKETDCGRKFVFAMMMSKGSPFVLPAILFFLVLAAFPVRAADREAGRFFLMGDGKLHIKNMHTGREASVSLLMPDGSLDEKGFDRVDEVFGFPTAEKGEHISPRLIFMLDYFSDLAAPGKTIRMVSAYRSPDYNSSLRNAGGNVARTSLHIDGMALDFNIPGVDGKALWQIIKEKNCCGVGHYGGANIHLDSARPRFWEAATSKVRTGESDYNRRMYLSTDYDRYGSGEKVRLFLAAVSDFGFGVKRQAVIVDNSPEHRTVATAPIGLSGSGDCLRIGNRKASRFITLSLPPELRPGRYRIRIGFCEKPFEQMPDETLSNEIEILGRMP